METFEVKMVVAVFLLLALLAIGYAGYSTFEPARPIGKTVEGNVIAHFRGGRTTTHPGFQVELSNGFRVYIRDYGELPVTYTGPVILNMAKGELSSRPMYTFNLAKTKVLHNKLNDVNKEP